MKSSPVAPPMRMLGGSPIRVAVPPMLLAMTWVIRNGRGSSSRSSQMAIVTGAISRIVVTLSRKAEATAVKRAKPTIMRQGSPPRAMAVRQPA